MSTANNDQHSVIQAANVPSGRIPDLRQSKFYIIRDPGEGFHDAIHGAIESTKGAEGVGNGSIVKFPTDQANSSVATMLQHWSQDKGLIEFAIDHVIARSHGPISEELREELQTLLSDPSHWKSLGIEIARDSIDLRKAGRESDSSEEIKGPGEGLLTSEAWHTDLDDSPDWRPILRIIAFPPGVRTTRIREGWHDHSEVGYRQDIPFAAGASTGEAISAPDGSVIAFEAASGVHSPPAIPVEEVGLERPFVSCDVDLGNVLYVAKNNLIDRASKNDALPPVPTPGFPTALER